MASFNAPKLSNHIADDVPAIKKVQGDLARLRPDDGNTDYPNGTVRKMETSLGYEFQQYNGSGWVTLEDWNINAQKVDGFSASQSATANAIAVRDKNGALPGNLTGNAATATKAAALSAVNPVAMGGTGATTAAGARTNLGVTDLLEDLDAAVVHKSGAETIAGAKTFTGNVTVPTTPADSTGNQVITADYLKSTGTYSPTSLPYYGGSSSAKVADFNALTAPGRYHVWYDTTAVNVPLAVSSVTDGILVVERIGPATDITTSARFRQTFYMFGGQSQSYRTFMRTGTQSSGNWKAWSEVLTNNGGTLSGNVTVSNDNPVLSLQGTTADKCATHTTTSRFGSVGFYDKNGVEAANRVAVVRAGFAGSVDGCLAEFLAHSPAGSATAGLQVVYPRTGGAYASAPTPAADSNTTHIATTAWVVSKIAASSTSSDATRKDHIEEIPEEVLKAWGKVNFKRFKYLEAIADKGDDVARWHAGVIVQEVIAAFEEEGLDATEWGIVCLQHYDESSHYEDVMGTDEEGNETVVDSIKIVDREAYDIWGISYNEALTLECAYQRWLGEQREARLAALEAQIMGSAE